jgi:CBS domain-containing protein
MLDNGVGCVLIVDDRGRLTGIVTESDFIAKRASVPFSMFQAPQLFGHWLPAQELDKAYAHARQVKAGEVMTRDVICVGEDATLRDVVLLMLERRISRIPVVKEGVLRGIVTRHDLLKTMAQTGHSPDRTVSDD